MAAVVSVFAVSLAFAVPASAQQSGLVNVEVTRVLNNNEVAVTVPINAAANVCGLTVGVLADRLTTGPVDCDARGNQDVTVAQ
jgi:hypothetical protein